MFQSVSWFLAIDMLVVLASALVYRNYESPLYAVVTIFTTSKVIDATMYGTDSGIGKMMFIISPKTKEIAQQIMEDVERGRNAAESARWIQRR